MGTVNWAHNEQFKSNPKGSERATLRGQLRVSF